MNHKVLQEAYRVAEKAPEAILKALPQGITHKTTRRFAAKRKKFQLDREALNDYLINYLGRHRIELWTY